MAEWFGVGSSSIFQECTDIREQSTNHKLEYTCEEVEMRDLQKGDHLAVEHKLYGFFGSYYYHGIYLGPERGVAEFGGQTKDEMKIELVDLAQFMKNSNLLRVNYPTGTCLSPKATVTLAEVVLETPDIWGPYDVLTNNCEHFAFKCKTGCRVSPQVLEEIESVLRHPVKRLLLRKSGSIFQWVLK